MLNKRFNKLAITSCASSIVGAVIVDLKGLAFVAQNKTLLNLLTILAFTGYGLGVFGGVIALFQIKKHNDLLKGKLSAFLGILLGLLGLSFMAFATYALYELQHM